MYFYGMMRVDGVVKCGICMVRVVWWGYLLGCWELFWMVMSEFECDLWNGVRIWVCFRVWWYRNGRYWVWIIDVRVMWVYVVYFCEIELWLFFLISNVCIKLYVILCLFLFEFWLILGLKFFLLLILFWRLFRMEILWV